MSLWSKDYSLLFVARFLSCCSFALLNAVSVSYAMLAYGASSGVAGWAVGVFVLASLVSRIFTGRYLDFIGRRRLVCAGGLSCAIACCAYALPAGIGGFLVVRVLHGIAYGAATNALATVSIDYIPTARIGEGLGYLSLTMALSMAVGPFFGVILLQRGLYFGMFALCAVLALASFVVTLFLSIEEGESAPLVKAREGSLAVAFFEPKALPLCTVALFICMATSCITSYLEPYADSNGLGWCVSWFFVVYSAFMVLSRILLGRLFDEKGADIIAYPCLVALLMGVVVLCGISPSAIFAAAMLVALGYGALFPGLHACILKNAPRQRVGVATATYYVFADAGIALGPIMGGFVANSFGYSCMCATCAVAVLVAAVVYRVDRRRYEEKRSR